MSVLIRTLTWFIMLYRQLQRLEPQTIAKTRKDTQRPANMCQRYAKTRKDMQSECAKLSHEHANIISILL